MANRKNLINFRIQSDDIQAELNRLAQIISTKYRKDFRISLREVRRR